MTNLLQGESALPAVPSPSPDPLAPIVELTPVSPTAQFTVIETSTFLWAVLLIIAMSFIAAYSWGMVRGVRLTVKQAMRTARRQGQQSAWNDAFRAYRGKGSNERPNGDSTAHALAVERESVMAGNGGHHRTD